MDTGVCRLAVHLVIAVILMTGSVAAIICYNESGGVLPGVAAPQQCCLGDGHFYTNSSMRINCIVYGFVSPTVSVREGETVPIDIAVLKGLPKEGRVFDVLGESSGKADFSFQGGRTVTLSEIRNLCTVFIKAKSDMVAMEGNKTFQLQLVPQDLLGESEFVAGPLSMTVIDTTKPGYRLCPRDVISVQEFFACMDPNNDLKPILGLGDVNVEEGTPCLALVVDTSGSMEKEITAAQRIIHRFLASEEHEPGCYVLVPFVDPTGEEKSIRKPTIATTDDKQDFMSLSDLHSLLNATNELIAPLFPGAGRDCPERQLDTLLEALRMRNDEEQEVMIPGSHIVMLTDASSHDPLKEADVIAAANKRSVCISFFLSRDTPCLNHEEEMIYERIANKTGGTVTREISENGFRDFASRHESTQCANFYGIPLLEQAQVFSSYDVYDNEKRCHSFATSLFTASLKVTAYTTQPAMIVTKPTGENISVLSTSRSSGLAFSESCPPVGEWKVCVDTGNMTVTVEKNDVMDSIIKYHTPIANSLQVLTTSDPPSACTTGQISVKNSRIANIQSADIQLLSEESGEVLMIVPLYGSGDLLLGNITFPGATVKYRIVGTDIHGYPFTISLSHSATFEGGDFRVYIGEVPVEIEPYQTISIPVSVHNLNNETAWYFLTYDRLTEFHQAFRPSNRFVVAPGMSRSVNLIAAAARPVLNSSHTITAIVTDGCICHSASRTVTIRLPATHPPPPPEQCGCQNGGVCTIREIKGRVFRRCTCPAEWGGTRCTIP